MIYARLIAIAVKEHAIPAKYATLVVNTAIFAMISQINANHAIAASQIIVATTATHVNHVLSVLNANQFATQVVMYATAVNMIK